MHENYMKGLTFYKAVNVESIDNMYVVQRKKWRQNTKIFVFVLKIQRILIFFDIFFSIRSDQRITQDIEKFCGSISSLYASTFKPVVDIILFTRKLVKSVGPGGPIMMYLYYFISGFIMRRLLPNFAKVTIVSSFHWRVL